MAPSSIFAEACPNDALPCLPKEVTSVPLPLPVLVNVPDDIEELFK